MPRQQDTVDHDRRDFLDAELFQASAAAKSVDLKRLILT
jgi:hypothetical protein